MDTSARPTEMGDDILVCLAMLAEHTGQDVTLAQLRSRYGAGVARGRVQDLIWVTRAIGLDAVPLNCGADELRTLELPLVTQWDGSFVLLVAVRRGGFVLHHPRCGRLSLGRADFTRGFGGTAISVGPVREAARRRSRRSLRLGRMLVGMKGFWRGAALALMAGIAIELLALMAPLFLEWLIDDALPSADRDLVLVLGIGMVLASLLRAVTAAARGIVIAHVGAEFGVRLSIHVVSHLLRLPGEWFLRRSFGDVISRVGAVDAIERLVTSHSVETVIDGVVAVISLALMWAYSPLLTAISAGTALLYALARWIGYGQVRSAHRGLLASGARQQTALIESIRGADTIRLFNRSAQQVAQYGVLVRRSRQLIVRGSRLSSLFAAFNTAVTGLDTAIVTYIGAQLVLGGHFTIGMLVAFQTYKGDFLRRMSNLADKVIDLRTFEIYERRLADILEAPAEATLPLPRLSFDRPAPSLTVSALRFRYGEGQPWVINNYNLTVEAGEFVVLTGRSGVGKTTLLKLMTGQLRPTSGRIALGSVDIQQSGLPDYRDRIGVVSQDDVLFAGTISENVCFFDPAPDQAWVEQCCKRACIHDEILAMGAGYNSVIGELGQSVSGGQRQRLLIARALYKRPQLLFLDEATSHLHAALAKSLVAMLRELPVTCILISHMIDVLDSVDRRIEM